jgi:hypothetical protein
VNTNVLIEDGGIVVLGGLIRDSAIRGEQRVPYLGRIPSSASCSRRAAARPTRPTSWSSSVPKILRDGQTTAIETGAKYNYIREEQRATMRPKSGSAPADSLQQGTDASGDTATTRPTLPIDQGTGLTGRSRARRDEARHRRRRRPPRRRPIRRRNNLLPSHERRCRARTEMIARSGSASRSPSVMACS